MGFRFFFIAGIYSNYRNVLVKIDKKQSIYCSNSIKCTVDDSCKKSYNLSLYDITL